MSRAMISKSKLEGKINTLQSSAAAICQACELRLSAKCRGPFCADIIPIVNEIDPLISESLRLQLAEMRAIYRKQPNLPMWQRFLPLLFSEVDAGWESTSQVCEVQLSIGSPREEESAPEMLPPERWGYSLLQIMLGWDNTIASGAHINTVRAPLAEGQPIEAAKVEKVEIPVGQQAVRMRGKLEKRIHTAATREQRKTV